jgi:hypothetical protein
VETKERWILKTSETKIRNFIRTNIEGQQQQDFLPLGQSNSIRS